MTVVFTVDTDTPPVPTKAEIDRLLTFCTSCNPACERNPTINFQGMDVDYNGLGTAYSGAWTDRRTLVITILNRELFTGFAYFCRVPYYWGLLLLRCG